MKARTIQIIGSQRGENLLERLKKSKEHFVVTESSYSVKIHQPEYKLTYLITPDFMALKNWGILSSIKSGITKNETLKELPELYSRDIHYFHYCEQMKIKKEAPPGFTKKFNNVAEIDISAAYITAAFHLGIISRENFIKLKRGPKQNRLKILGALATQKLEKYYIGPDLVEQTIIVNRFTRNCWFHICALVDKLMNDLLHIIRDRVLFYYVDNIYFYNDPGLMEFIQSFFQAQGFKTTRFNLDSFFIYNSSKGALAVIRRVNEPTHRTFFIPNNKIIKYIIE